MRKAFSLMELLIIVVIMGVVYNLAIGSFQKITEVKPPLSLKELKKYLSDFEREESVEFLCLDRCSSCDVFVDGKKQEELHGEFDDFLDDSVKIYRYEYGLGAIRVEPKAYFNSEDVEEDVCFSYALNKQGIGEQVLVEFKGSVYDFSPYFSDTLKYGSLDDAINAKDVLVQETLR